MRLDNVVSVESVLRSAEREREDRRLLRRAKITAQVHVRGMNSAEAFEEVCKTVDLSRDGMLFIGRNRDYTKGQLLEVTFPYSSAPGAQNQAQPAEVVRVVAQPHGKSAVAVHFLAAKQKAPGASNKDERRVAPSLYHDGALINESLNESTNEQKSPLVLAFEPDAAAAGVMQKMLEGQGYTFVAVKTGVDALEFLKANVPDVFVAEIETEDVSGRDLSIIIRRDERLARVPVVLLTRSAEPESQKLGAVVVCMTKPFQPERLQQVIRLIAPPPESRGFYGDQPLSEDLVDRTLAYKP
jgi:CheY-like chemotaxis protein